MHYLANPARFLRIAKALTPWLLWPGLGLLLAGCYGGLFMSPPDYLQGETVRMLYIHVPAAWLGMAGWGGIGAASLMYLVWRHPLAAVAAKAVAAPGAIFTALGRMTSMLVMLFLYLGYLAFAGALREKSDNDRALAVFGVIGVVNLPIIHGSVIWWKSLHQPPSLGMKGSAIASEILWPLGLTMAGFTLLFAAIVLMRMRTMLATAKTEARMLRMALD
ncbi:MAG: cytochrome c biogenesis protein CcsA [Usitatibacteraceae bacterium]